jgi:hypothetical protein
MKYLKKFNETFGQNGMFDWKISDMKHTPASRAHQGLEQEEDQDIEDCYTMAYDKIDKMLPVDPELQKEFYEIIDSEDEITTKYAEMEEFFVINLDEDRFDSYCKNGNLKDFAIYVVQKELDIEEDYE